MRTEKIQGTCDYCGNSRLCDSEKEVDEMFKRIWFESNGTAHGYHEIIKGLACNSCYQSITLNVRPPAIKKENLLYINTGTPYVVDRFILKKKNNLGYPTKLKISVFSDATIIIRIIALMPDSENGIGTSYRKIYSRGGYSLFVNQIGIKLPSVIEIAERCQKIIKEKVESLKQQ